MSEVESDPGWYFQGHRNSTRGNHYEIGPLPLVRRSQKLKSFEHVQYAWNRDCITKAVTIYISIFSKLFSFLQPPKQCKRPQRDQEIEGRSYSGNNYQVMFHPRYAWLRITKWSCRMTNSWIPAWELLQLSSSSRSSSRILKYVDSNRATVSSSSLQTADLNTSSQENTCTAPMIILNPLCQHDDWNQRRQG